ncbi:MAG: AAA family ATPase [Chitinivibrionales bacterium]|nr:AAA family ATPase [Chitinivibrionales bacterium]
MILQPWLVNNRWEQDDPKLDQLRSARVQLPHTARLANTIDLDPPGILIVRGPRQTGKSTFLRQFAAKSLAQGAQPDKLAIFDAERSDSWQDLLFELESFLKPRLNGTIVLVDEVTSVRQWWKALKILADDGLARNALFVCTGSNAMDLAKGADLLPGRRGKRHPVDYELLPVRYYDVARELKLDEFLLTGGMPWAIGEYLEHGYIPSFVYALYSAWIEGAFIRSGHTRSDISPLLHYLAKRTGSPTSVISMARDCGIGSNSTAEALLTVLESNYITLASHWSEPGSSVSAPRKNRKFFPADPFIFHLFNDFGKGWDQTWQLSSQALADPVIKSALVEALVASELRHFNTMTPLRYFLGKKEIDFIGNEFIEVKYQRTVSIQEFFWVKKIIPPKAVFTVITQQTRSRDENIRLIPLEDWLLEKG